MADILLFTSVCVALKLSRKLGLNDLSLSEIPPVRKILLAGNQALKQTSFLSKLPHIICEILDHFQQHYFPRMSYPSRYKLGMGFCDLRYSFHRFFFTTYPLSF